MINAAPLMDRLQRKATSWLATASSSSRRSVLVPLCARVPRSPTSVQPTPSNVRCWPQARLLIRIQPVGVPSVSNSELHRVRSLALLPAAIRLNARKSTGHVPYLACRADRSKSKGVRIGEWRPTWRAPLGDYFFSQLPADVRVGSCVDGSGLARAFFTFCSIGRCSHVFGLLMRFT